MYCTVQTVAAVLRQGEHIPKMQNDIGHKITLRMLRHARSRGYPDTYNCVMASVESAWLL
jgi:hypothetical protein